MCYPAASGVSFWGLLHGCSGSVPSVISVLSGLLCCSSAVVSMSAFSFCYFVVYGLRLVLS